MMMYPVGVKMMKFTLKAGDSGSAPGLGIDSRINVFFGWNLELIDIISVIPTFCIG